MGPCFRHNKKSVRIMTNEKSKTLIAYDEDLNSIGEPEWDLVIKALNPAVMSVI